MKSRILGKAAVASLAVGLLFGSTAPVEAINILKIRSYLDANGDGALTRGELSSRVNSAHRTADKNGDGQLTWAEAESGLRLAARRVGMSSGRASSIINKKMKPRFRWADTNKNGKLSRSEMRNAVMQRFRKYDRNKDGRVTLLEAMR